jgi:AraC family transcriptional regulator
VDNKEDMDKIEQDMYKMDIPGGLYAVFTTPLVVSQQYAQSIRDTWKTILVDWLPDSGYKYDEGRYDFEYYDERDHSWEHNNMVQMDIYIPIRK